MGRVMQNRIINNILLILAFYPLVLIPGLIYPTISGKMFFIRTLVFLAFAFTCLFCLKYSLFEFSLKNELKKLKNNKIIISLFLYFLIFTTGIFFALDKFTYFWGERRGEGFIGFLFYFLFLFLTLLFFKNREYKIFLKISIVVSVIISCYAIFQYLDSGMRVDSFFGNPAFLSTYLIFSIFSSFVVMFFSKKNKEKFWFFFSMASVPLFLSGIFLTNTRGALIGLSCGFLGLLFYFIFNRFNILIFNKIKLHKFAIMLLILITIFTSIFLLTRHNNFWQKIPGLDRLSLTSLGDGTVKSRLIVTQISLDSINPKNEGLEKFIFGWGWENYQIAWQKYYQPELYFYDKGSFDRAHNKIFDILVMNGFLGLIFYLSMWFFVFRDILRKKNKSIIFGIFFFFAISYFIQNLFLFDHYGSWIPFMFFISFLIYQSNLNKNEII